MKFRFLILFLFAAFLTKAQEITLMSYNIRLDVASDGENRWDARKEKVAQLMLYNNPDFIGAQEVQHHQLSYLLEQLKPYSSIGVGRDNGKTGGEYSNIFYRTDRFSVIKQSTFWLSPTPDSVSRGWDAACHRVCTYGLFEDKKSKKQFWVFNTHFDHMGAVARLESAKLVLKRIQSLNTQNLPVLFCGDFNSAPEDPPVQLIGSVLKDARNLSPVVHGPADTWNAFHFHEKPKGCIDHIFVSANQWKVTRFATLTDSYDLKYPSDHFPVMATVEFRTNGGK